MYEVVNQAGELTANAKTVVVVYDYATGQPVPVSESIRARLMAS
jgi:acyl-CoA thioesterase FadM